MENGTSLWREGRKRKKEDKDEKSQGGTPTNRASNEGLHAWCAGSAGTSVVQT